VAVKSTEQRGMEEAPESGKESSHSAHANGMNECHFCALASSQRFQSIFVFRTRAACTCSIQIVVFLYLLC